MDELEMIEEQPQNVETSVEENIEGSSSEQIEEKESTSEAERGVPIGKFKSVEDLFQAYNNLQSEFTRKSQKLADLERDKMTAEPSEEDKTESALKSFLSKNQEAFVYADELKVRVENANVKDEAAFESAWAGLLYEKLTGKDRAKEPIIQNLIKDDEIQNLVIENYMKQLQEQKIPVVMSSNSGERVTKVVAPKPDSFEEAKRVVLDLFDKN